MEILQGYCWALELNGAIALLNGAIRLNIGAIHELMGLVLARAFYVTDRPICVANFSAPLDKLRPRGGTGQKGINGPG
jgi:hypothetical protein